MDNKTSLNAVNHANCYIFGAAPVGDIPKLEPKENDLIIAADGGLTAINSLGLEPDIVLGDFKSLGEIPRVECKLIRHPVEKDDTDMGLAVKTALAMGYGKLYLLGGLGGERPDHTLANLQTLVYIAKNGGIGFLYTGYDTFANIFNRTREKNKCR